MDDGPIHKKQKLITTMLPRPTALRLALEDPPMQWTNVPDHYKNDPEFVAEFIRKAKTLPHKNVFERTMTQELRMSKGVALAFVSRDDFEQLYMERQLFLPHVLNNDKQVVLQYCQKIPRALQMADNDMCDDHDIIMAAVQRDGFEIQYASVRLQSDESIIRAACQKNGRAIEVCANSETLQRLLRDRDFLLMAFRNGGGAAMRNVVDPVILRDDELWLEAVTHGLEIRYVPPSISSASFWEGVLRVKSSLYHSIRKEFQDNPIVAKAALFAGDLCTSLLELLYDKFPHIFDATREVALAVVRMGSFAKRYLDKHPTYFDDREIMLIAVQNNPKLYFNLTGHLSLSTPIIKAALTAEKAHEVLKRLGLEWLQNHEDICIEAIRVASTLAEAANAIPDEIWQSSRALALTWLKRRCRVLEIFRERLENDREMAMAVAQYVDRDFTKIGLDFQQDPGFLEEAVSLNGRIISHVRDPSLELVVSATGTYPAAAAEYPELPRHVEEVLARANVFRDEFLRGVCLPSSTLSQLNVDAETSTAFKQSVAQFLGVPVGKTLTLYKRCHESLRCSKSASVSRNDHAVANPPDLPFLFGSIRRSLRGGNLVDDLQIDHDHRLANILLDDGLPFHMLRHEQQLMLRRRGRIRELAETRGVPLRRRAQNGMFEELEDDVMDARIAARILALEDFAAP